MNTREHSKLNTNPEDGPEAILRLFVYGTLKRGYWNHQRFCTQALSIEPAVVWGRLYHLHAGFPALEVPEGMILAWGTDNPLADARRQQEISRTSFVRPTGDWDLINGEIVTFTNPQLNIPPIDQLEGFRPDRHSMYQRVMVAARCGNVSTAVWIYRMAQVIDGDRIDREWQGY